MSQRRINEKGFQAIEFQAPLKNFKCYKSYQNVNKLFETKNSNEKLVEKN